ncbi:MAG: sigma-70 family RNA polymerase sigma factor [Firmicutes bacterium]|nr:sigma-70 family RNA polymerase sigma factor [Bacillota bacterium]
MTYQKLGELILSSENTMYRTAFAILQSKEDAADAIQEAIVKAFSRINSLQEDRFAKTWLMRILMNECFDQRRKRDRTISLDTISEPADSPREEYSELYWAISRLEDDLRIPVILFYVEDYSTRQIAELLEISEGAVRKRLYRARARLKEELTELED